MEAGDGVMEASEGGGGEAEGGRWEREEEEERDRRSMSPMLLTCQFESIYTLHPPCNAQLGQPRVQTVFRPRRKCYVDLS